MFKQKICFDVWGNEKGGKYRLRDKNGNEIDKTPEDTCDRVSKTLADVEQKDKEYWFKEFRSILGTKFAGAGRIMANAGAQSHKKETSLINCVVSKQIADSMKGIMDAASEASIILKGGSGIGYEFSSIRPRGALVYGAGAGTSGVISFMKIFDAICSTVESGGNRRGSQMACLDIQHPDIEEFISAKRQDGILRYFNLSCLLTDKFMNAVKNNEEWHLWFWEKQYEKLNLEKERICIIKPQDIPFNHPEFDYFQYDKNHQEVKFENCTEHTIFKKKIYKTLKAKELFDQIMKSNYSFGEPGCIFIDRVNQENNLWFCETIRACNPCFSGDTLIAVADGRNAVSIKQLSEEGKDVPVYSINTDGMVEIKIGRNPRITGINQKLFRVTLDDGSYIETTPNHKFILLSGEIKECKDLLPGDSLPKFLKLKEPIKQGKKSYYRVHCNTANMNSNKIFEHRLIAKFYQEEKWNQIYKECKKSGFAKTGGLVVHHINYNGLDNRNSNLEIMNWRDHNQLHAKFDTKGEKNGRCYQITNKELEKIAINLTKKKQRRLSIIDWKKYAQKHNLPKSFSYFRKNYFGGNITFFLKSCAEKVNVKNIELDPRVAKTYLEAIEQKYNPKILNGRIFVEKICELCKKNFHIKFSKREQSYCSHSCAYIKKEEFYKNKIIEIKIEQMKIWSELQFFLCREPFYKEWKQECKNKKISYRFNTKNGFKNYTQLKLAGKNYNHKVVNVQELPGEHIVYNITVDFNHTVGIITKKDANKTIAFGGIFTKQCGEQMLGPESVCLLGSMILPAYISNPFTKNVSFDWEQFKKDIRTANRFLDNVVEINNLPLKSLDDTLRYQRRHGLGITGLGSLFNLMCIKYGSRESIEFAEKIAQVMAIESLEESIAIAKEKGPAPFCKDIKNRRNFVQSGFMKRLLDLFDKNKKEQIIKDILEFGVRNSHNLSIAPTGTLSLTFGNNCSNGIEPVFLNSTLRNIRIPGRKTKTQVEIMDYSYFEWKKLNGDKPLPNWWSTTETLSVNDHLVIQEVMQRWIDSAVSKTINIPASYSFEEFKNVYIEGYNKGLKGITTFRFNPEMFSGVLVSKENLEKTKYKFILEDKTELIVSGNDTIEYDGEEHNAANLFDALKEGLYGNI